MGTAAVARNKAIVVDDLTDPVPGPGDEAPVAAVHSI